MLHRCEECPGKLSVENNLRAIFEEAVISHDDNRSSLISVQDTVDSFIERFSQKLDELSSHHYISKEQLKYLSDSKKNLKSSECIALMDFAENYLVIIQDAIQSQHWSNTQDFGLKAEWHFFATFHGKSPCDGIGGTTKRLVARASLQALTKDQILNARDFYTYADAKINGIKFFWVDKKEIKDLLGILEKDLDLFGYNFNKNESEDTNDDYEPGRFGALVYNKKWYLGNIIERDDKNDDLKVQTIFGNRPVKLLRIRNPWGEEEWNGDWSDNSSRWSSVSEDVKIQLQMLKRDNGEFWPSLWYAKLVIHMEQSAYKARSALYEPTYAMYMLYYNKDRKKTGWEVISFHSEWIKGYNAFGSSVFTYRRDQFFKNPQFRIALNPAAATSSSSDKCHMIVSLMQMTKSWNEQNFISFDIYKLRPGVNFQADDHIHNFTKDEMQYVTHNESYVNLREVTARYVLPPGQYVIIPHTYEQNKAGQFLLRVYTEVKAEEDNVDMPTNVLPPKPPTSIVEDRIHVQADGMFQYQNKNLSDADAKELMAVLDAAFKKDGWTGFTSMEAARCLISLYGKTKPGFVTLNEFYTLWAELRLWLEKFRKFDTDKSGTIDCNELDRVYISIGVQVSRNVVDAVVCKFGGRSKDVTVDEFVLCSCKIKNIYVDVNGVDLLNCLNFYLSVYEDGVGC
ncbi:hypothetical protein HELRODRAFT_170931 [Helobdella robusta]|uniref:Calpain catalytic domain-containing protein n=1 Tax=Helobdella robusta TaxID=6412 RepID=T1F3L9_HELRO|nr:hypothetical protein HELRODRAFT_170931 [Helobdella robusta]ESO06896.1 hypothetical protein HELRODRAFT_170931 [Helobdella robusta]